MAGLALVFLILGIVWLFFKVTTYALPCLIGLAAAQWAFDTRVGWIGAFVVFGLTALPTFGLMRWLFTAVAHPAARILLAIAFVAPAVVVSYLILSQLSEGLIPSGLWRQGLCLMGSGLMGLMALGRLVENDRRDV